MNHRLAQIIASSIGPDGKPNRAKIFDELSLSPDAPEVILIDAFFAADESFRALKAGQAKGLEAFKSVLDSELQQLVQALGTHRLTLAAAANKLESAAQARQAQLEASAKELVDQSGVSAAAAQKALQAADAQARASDDAVKKVTQAAERVASAHTTAQNEASVTLQELKTFGRNLAEREQIWFMLWVFLVAAILGAIAQHYLIEPRFFPPAADSSR